MTIERVKAKIKKENTIVTNQVTLPSEAKYNSSIKRESKIEANAVDFTRDILVTESGEKLITESSENILTFDPPPYTATIKRQNVIIATVKHTLNI
tara:strand:+ start:1195 stop:1482 length:288 start_codon:yes stop_codon:yes gene_type:complete